MTMSSRPFILCAVCLCALSTRAWGLSLGPALFMVQNVKPGQPVDVKKMAGVTFKVANDGDADATFNLNCKQPSKGGLSDWEEGYEEIPDAKWAKLEKEEFVVPAKSTAEIGLTIEVPDKPEYYNCKWMLAVVLSSGKVQKIGVGLAIAARVQIETLPIADKTTGGAAAIAPIPDLLQIEVKSGAAFEQSVILSNNTKRVLDCKSQRLVDVYPKDEKKYPRYDSPGHKALVKESWLTSRAQDAAFSIKPGETHEYKISGKIPDTAKPGEKWEELVFVTAPPEKPDAKGVAARETRTFFRVQYHIAEEKK